MSCNTWIKLHDVRVDVAAQDAEAPAYVALCVARMFCAEQFIPDCEQDPDYFDDVCECHGANRQGDQQ